jgi:hypothetical protein
MITTNSLVLFTVCTLVFTVYDYYAFISIFYCTYIRPLSSEATQGKASAVADKRLSNH